MKTAIAYIRVSKEREAKPGEEALPKGKRSLGLKAQEHEIERFAQANDYSVIGVFHEVETGKGFDALSRRPQLAAALALAKKTRSQIIVAKLDRLSRDVEFIAHLMNQSVDFICVEHPDAPTFMLHIYAAVAQEERRKIGVRTRDALQAAKRKGVKLGSLVIAKRRIAEARTTAERYRDILTPLADSNYSLRQIATMLNEQRCLGPSGGPWHSTTVFRVLRRLGLTA